MMHFSHDYEQGIKDEREKIIRLLEADICSNWTVDCCDGACSAYTDAIKLIIGQQK